MADRVQPGFQYCRFHLPSLPGAKNLSGGCQWGIKGDLSTSQFYNFLCSQYRLIARYIMAAMLVVRSNKIFFLWELMSIVM